MGQVAKFLPKRRRNRDADVITVLDIGTSKICCLIATAEAPHQILGVGYHRSAGVRGGLIVDLEAAETAVRTAVARAERQAGISVRAVHVGLSGGQLHSSVFTATADVPAGVVGDADVTRLIEGARAYCRKDGRALVHLNRIAFRLDASAAVRDPLGMAGHVLAGDMHAVTADEGPVRNLRLLLERCLLQPARVTPSPIASARAVVTPEEMQLGVTVIDIGAGTTKIAIIADGHDILAASLPDGGDHLTFDIMSALGTSLPEAERIKILYGTVVEAGSDERDVVTYPRLNRYSASDSGAEVCQTSRGELRRLLVPRVETLLAQAMERVIASGLQAYGGDRIVVTGGGAQLVGLPLLAGRLFDRPVRIGSPSVLPGMAAGSGTPAMAEAMGLVAAASNPATLDADGRTETAPQDSYLGRVGQWLRESF